MSIVVMVLAGVVLVRQATAGIIEAKKEASLNEAIGAYVFMQEELRQSQARAEAVHESLNRLADHADAQAAQYHVVIEGPGVNFVSSGIDSATVPDTLRQRVREGAGMFVTPTKVIGAKTSEPGIVIGTALIGSAGERYPVYYIFPLTTEVGTLRWLEGAVGVTGAVVVLALALISYLVTQQIVRPVRRASSTALKLASGQLGERMTVRGTDDLASLARSMNQMAGQLQQRIRELETLSTVQQRFVSDVSHELRTPMTTIKMASDLLYDAREDFDPLVARSAEIMNTEIDRFDTLLADLLEISRFDAGAAVLAPEETDLAVLVADEVEAHIPMAANMNTELVFRKGEGNTMAEVDPRRIRRIVRNLVTNAIEHGEGKPIVVTVAASETSVAVTVRDYGVGFAAEDAPRVFERFWRADPSRNRVVGGSGLGLAIAMEDARLHHGTLAAWSRPGRGAQFRLTLPRSTTRRLRGSPLPLIPVDSHTPGEA